MTADVFVRSLEEYYGAYKSGLMREMMLQYIGQFEAAEIKALQEIVFLTFSAKYGKTPDVAAVREIRDENKKEINKRTGKIWEADGEVFKGEKFIGHYDGSSFIPCLADIQGTSLLLEYHHEFNGIAPSPEKFVRFLEDVGITATNKGLIEDKTGGEK